jgi:hypothetical protein
LKFQGGSVQNNTENYEETREHKYFLHNESTLADQINSNELMASYGNGGMASAGNNMLINLIKPAKSEVTFLKILFINVDYT